MTDITVTGHKNFKPSDFNLHMRIDGKIYDLFESFSFTRSLEQVPSTFTVQMPLKSSEGKDYPDINTGKSLEVYLHKKRIFTGVIEQLYISLSNNSHVMCLSGRSSIKDLIDSTPIFGGTSINGVQSLYDLCQKVAGYYGIKVINKSTKPDKTNWTSVPFNLGDTGWAILDRYAAYQGKLLYDDGAGHLVIDDVGNTLTGTINNSSYVVNASYSEDISQRFAEYVVVWSPFTPLADDGIPPLFTASDPQKGLFRDTRKMVMINSANDDGQNLAQSYANWNANRRYGRSKSVNLTTTGWVNGLDKLWEVNQLVQCELPSIRANSSFVISSVTYSFDYTSGSQTNLQLLPPEAFSFEPVTLYSGADASLQNIPKG